MKIIGLTGGIASGKSTVARLFAQRGAVVFSADEDARAVLSDGSPTLSLVFAAFHDCQNPDGSLNRSALAAHIFADSKARAQLEQIMHPAIFERMKANIASERKKSHGLVIYEVPLLFEKQREGMFDAIIATNVTPDVQRARLQAREEATGRPHLSDTQIAERLAAQLPVEEKARRADYVIDTGGTLTETEAQVDKLWHRLLV